MIRLALVAALLAIACAGQTEMTLEQAGQRSGSDFAPANEGKLVRVHGIVASKAVWALDSYYVPIEDRQDYGLLLQGTLAQLEPLLPGRALTATGVLVRRGGLAVLQPRELRVEAMEAPPKPRTVVLGDLTSFRYMGVLVKTEGRITSIGFNAGGDLITMTDHETQISIFYPKTRRDTVANSFSRLNVGDRVGVTGIASQYCPLPPYDRYFQVLVSEPGAVVMLQRGALIPPFLLLTAVTGIALILMVWWLREHRMAAQRKAMRSLNTLSEEIIAAGSPGEILKKLASVMPEVSGATGVRLYIYNRRTRMLDRVVNPRDPEPLSINVEAPTGSLPTGAALAFRNRALLNIPDTRRSPFFKAGSKELPRSVMFVPMFAQNEVGGVLEVAHAEGIRYFTHEEQAATQHLANQVAASLRLQEQQSMREQLFRSEKLAATGQLISGVANELRSPLESILGISKKLLVQPQGATGERDMQVLFAEAQRAAEIVARLVSFGRVEESEAKPVEINGLISSLMQFREREWKTLGIDVKVRLARDPLYTTGAQGQLEQVFLNVLVHAEQCILETAEKTISIDASAVGRRVMVEISYSVKNSEESADPLAGRNTEGSALGLGVSRGVVQNHGGDIRFSRPTPKQCRFEVDLPLASATESRSAESVRPRARRYTTMVVEPDAALCRQLVAALSARNHRVVPVISAEEGADLVQRVRFDAVMCSMRLPGLNWVEFFERVREQAGAFVLLTEGYDPALSRTFGGAEGFVLSKPLNEAELDKLLGDIENHADRGLSLQNK